MEFVGKSLALTSDGLANAATQLSVGVPEISAVFSVETLGTGFLPDRRPQILFERHYFSRLTGGSFDSSNPEVSAPTPGGYGDSGAHQYDRLAQAISLNGDAALRSASWGLAQVMGDNHQAAGYGDAEEMVAAMSDSEDAQLSAMASFIRSARLASSIATHNWAAFARGYNGPNYVINRYDVELSGFYQKYLVSPMPDLNIRAAQIYLQFRGFDPHGVDGILGAETADAIRAFQGNSGLTPSGALDDATMQALVPD